MSSWSPDLSIASREPPANRQGQTPVRVALLGPSLDIIGGQAVAVRDLLVRLKGVEGVEVSFIPMNPRARGLLRRAQRIRYIRTVVTSIHYWWSLLRDLRRVDVAHVFSPAYWAFLLGPVPAMLAGRAFGKRVILNYHSGEADDHLSRHGWFAIPLMRMAHRIVVPSGYLVDVFRAHGLEAVAVPNFIDVQRFDTGRKREPGSRLLSNRNLELHYGVDDVLRAFAELKRHRPAASLTVVGDGSQAEALRKLAGELGLVDVQFVGAIQPEAMAQYYAEHDILVNASRIDNMPLSLLEANAARLPVVTTDAGGIPWIVDDGQTALVVASGDWKSLANALLQMLNDAEMRGRMVDRARAVVEERYTWAVARDGWLGVYMPGAK